MPPIAVIDLDAAGDPGPPEPRRRGWLPALVAIAVLVLAGAGVPAAPLGPALVLPPDGIADVRADGSAVYVLTSSAVAAYAVPGGGQRWAVPVTAAAQLVAADGTRVVIAEEGPDGASSTLTGLDARSGGPVWRLTGYVPSLHGTAGAAGVVVADVYHAGSDVADLAGVDTRTGAMRWSLVTTPGSTRALDPVASDGPDFRVAIAELDGGGMLRVHRAETGEVVRTVTLERPGRIDGFDVAGERLLAYQSDMGVLTSSAVFDLTTGRQLWNHPDEQADVQVRWCGSMLCRGGTDGVSVLDPDTGAVRWQLAGWTDLGPLGNGRMLATRAAPGGLVLDDATGRVEQRFEGWSVIGRTARGGLLVVASWSPLLGDLDPGTGAVRVLGRAPSWPTPPQCTTTAMLMACWSGRVSIWPANT